MSQSDVNIILLFFRFTHSETRTSYGVPVFSLLAISFITYAQAEPLKGLRLNMCAGFGSHCPFAQIGVGYNFDKVSIDIGGFGPFPLGAHAGIQYYPFNSETNRVFIGASAGGGTILLGGVGGVGGFVGTDFHLLSSRKLILTPRIGLDFGNVSVGSAAEEYTSDGTAFSFSLETAYAY